MKEGKSNVLSLSNNLNNDFSAENIPLDAPLKYDLGHKGSIISYDSQKSFDRRAVFIASQNADLTASQNESSGDDFKVGLNETHEVQTVNRENKEPLHADHELNLQNENLDGLSQSSESTIRENELQLPSQSYNMRRFWVKAIELLKRAITKQLVK